MSEVTQANHRRRLLVLLRHGESSANADDAFGGWLDFPLTDRGRDQAAAAGRLLVDAGLRPEVVHTSLLSRAVDTAGIAVAAAQADGIPVYRHWRLNERHYGLLQGRPRDVVRDEFGAEQVARWRRSFDVAPPPLDVDHPDHPRFDPRYAELPPWELPAAESLATVRQRLVPYWQDSIAADLSRGLTTLVVAHGNSLRALCMHLDRLTPDEVQGLEIPIGAPLRYDLDHELVPLVRGGQYLDTTSPRALTR